MGTNITIANGIGSINRKKVQVIPPVKSPLIDAWFMAGLKNEGEPSSIVGINGKVLIVNNFTWTSTSGFNNLGGLVFDGIDDNARIQLSELGISPTDTFTIISKYNNGDNSGNVYNLYCANIVNGVDKFIRIADGDSNTEGIRCYTFDGETGNVSNKQLASNNEFVEASPISDTNRQIDMYLSLNGAYVDVYGILGTTKSIHYWCAIYRGSLTTEEIDKEKVKLDNEWNKRLIK